MRERIVRHLDCEFCTAETQAHCIVCGGRGYVELVSHRVVPDEPDEEDEPLELPE